MSVDSAYEISPWLLYPVAILLIAGAAEIGRWLGRRYQAGTEGNIDTLEGAGLGLLALIIGFTFSMALTRFESRKDAILSEANAIGTVALRAEMLAPAQAATVAALLLDYARARLALGTASDSDIVESRGVAVAAIARSLEVQSQLWQQALLAGAADPRSVPVGLFTSALNDMIDMHEKRLTALRNHVPGVVFVMLLGIGMVSMGLVGYGAAIGRREARVPHLVMAAMIGSVIILIFDIDRSQQGLVRVSQQPMQDLIAGLSVPATPPAPARP